MSQIILNIPDNLPADIVNQYIQNVEQQIALLSKLMGKSIENTSNQKALSIYQAFEQAGLIGCIETDEQLASTYKEKLDFSIKHGTSK